jgi:hypothetical protein
VPEGLHDRIKRERDAAQPEARKVRTYRHYAEGRQRGTISHEQRRILNSLIGHDHADNLMDAVLDAAASRLDLTGFRVADEAVSAYLAEFFVRNQLAAIPYHCHYPTLRDGNHYLGLRWHNDDRPQPTGTPIDDEGAQPGRQGRVTVHHEPAWDGETGMFVAYEDDGRTYAYAVKEFDVWLGDPPVKRKRRTVYFWGSFQRFVLDGQGWVPFFLPGDPEDGRIPWTRTDGTPMAPPVVHFPNGRFGAQPYGISDLAGGVIGLQDEVNDFQRDISAAGRLTAYQMVTLVGHDAGDKPITVGPGQLLWSANPNARFGTIPAGDLAQLIAGHDKKVATIARSTRTPLHLITGAQWPSGEALIRAEMPLVDRVRRSIRTIGPAWVLLAHRGTEIANAFGRERLNEDALIAPVFTDPERRDALTLAQVDVERLQALLIKQTLGWSLAAVQREWGLTEHEIAAMEGERQKEAEAAGLTAPIETQQQSQQQGQQTQEGA